MGNYLWKIVWGSEDKVLNKQESEKTNEEETGEENKCYSQHLIYDVLRLIFEYLNGEELSNASMVCRFSSEVANNEKRARGPVCLIRNPAIPYETTDEQKRVNIEINKKLRIKSALGLFFIPIIFTPSLIFKDYWCEGLPSNCFTIKLITTGVIMDEENLKHIINVFLPDIPNVLIKQVSLVYASYFKFEGVFMSRQDIIEEIKRVLNTPAKGHGISKCLLLFCNRECDIRAIQITNYVEKCYEANELSVWGGIAKYIGISSEIVDSNCIPFCTAIVLIGPIDTWSLILDKTHNTKERVERRLTLFRNRICLRRHSIGLMFACCTRGKKMFKESNVESSIFKKLFPKVPLVGCFGPGAFGTNKIPNGSDNKKTGWYQTIATVFLIITYD